MKELKVYSIPCDVPDGCEPVAWRVPKEGEPIEVNGEVHPAIPGHRHPRLILRRIYKFSDFIPPGWWIAMQSDHSWWLYENEPYITSNSNQFVANGGIVIRLTGLIWTPPEVTDWRNSKMQKPLEER